MKEAALVIMQAGMWGVLGWSIKTTYLLSVDPDFNVRAIMLQIPTAFMLGILVSQFIPDNVAQKNGYIGLSGFFSDKIVSFAHKKMFPVIVNLIAKKIAGENIKNIDAAIDKIDDKDKKETLKTLKEIKNKDLS